MGENQLNVIAAPTIRAIVRFANEESIKKEDIVAIIKDNGQFLLLYYK